MKKVILIFIALFSTSPARAEEALSVAVIAHSVSTSMEAREIRIRQGWLEADYTHADALLVVCRSMLLNPLMHGYGSIEDLDRDTENQLNIAGSNFHVYIYQINADFSVSQIKHLHYPAE